VCQLLPRVEYSYVLEALRIGFYRHVVTIVVIILGCVLSTAPSLHRTQSVKAVGCVGTQQSLSPPDSISRASHPPSRSAPASWPGEMDDDQSASRAASAVDRWIEKQSRPEAAQRKSNQLGAWFWEKLATPSSGASGCRETFSITPSQPAGHRPWMTASGARCVVIDGQHRRLNDVALILTRRAHPYRQRDNSCSSDAHSLSTRR